MVKIHTGFILAAAVLLRMILPADRHGTIVYASLKAAETKGPSYCFRVKWKSFFSLISSYQVYYSLRGWTRELWHLFKYCFLGDRRPRIL